MIDNCNQIINQKVNIGSYDVSVVVSSSSHYKFDKVDSEELHLKSYKLRKEHLDILKSRLQLEINKDSTDETN